MSDNILVALPEQVSLELLGEGPTTAEAVLQPRGPVLDVVLDVVTDTSKFVSLVVGLSQMVTLVRKLVKWRRSSSDPDRAINISLRDGLTVQLQPDSDEAAIAEVAELLLQHVSRASQTKSTPTTP